MKATIKSIEWYEDKWQLTNLNGTPGVILTGLNGLISVYECTDSTWRVRFDLGYATSVMDVRQRNIASREEAIRIANEWWREWLLTKLDVATE